MGHPALATRDVRGNETPLARAGFRFLRTEVAAVDVEKRSVRTADGDLPYDVLVIVLGSVTNDFGIPGVHEHGRTSAAAEFARPVHVVLSGLPAWTMWRANYLMQLLGARNRGTLLAEWVLSYFSRRIVADIT